VRYDYGVRRRRKCQEDHRVMRRSGSESGMRVRIGLKVMAATVAVLFCGATLWLARSYAQPITGQQIASEVIPQLSPHTLLVILSVRSGQLDFSASSAAIVSSAAAELRNRGFAIRTLEEQDVQAEALQQIGRYAAAEAASIGRLCSSIGVATALVLNMSTGTSLGGGSVRASLYTRIAGTFEEVWMSRVGWKQQTPDAFLRSPERSGFRKFSEGPAPGRSVPRENGGVQAVTSCTPNLIRDGDFASDWPTAWKRNYSGSGANVTEITHDAGGNVLHIRHTGQSEVELIQVVPVATGRLLFSYEARFHTWEGPIAGFTGSGIGGISLSLMDGRNSVLGIIWTGNYLHNIFEGTGLAGVPQGPRDSPVTAFFEEPSDRKVHEELDLSKIIRDRLVRVNAGSIRSIVISIGAAATHPSAGAEMWVGQLSLKVCPN
jgi:hypothetical protein